MGCTRADFHRCGFWPGPPNERSVSMRTQHAGVLPPPSRPGATGPVDPQRERERLRRELLKRIIDREMRRKSSRGGPR